MLCSEVHCGSFRGNGWPQLVACPAELDGAYLESGVGEEGNHRIHPAFDSWPSCICGERKRGQTDVVSKIWVFEKTLNY